MITEKSIVVSLQQERMKRYKQVLAMAETEEERKPYEVSRLKHIKDPDVIERGSWLLK